MQHLFYSLNVNLKNIKSNKDEQIVLFREKLEKNCNLLQFHRVEKQLIIARYCNS
jgi:hypothetical protein